MLPINPSQNTQPSLASYLPRLDSPFSDAGGQIHSAAEIYEAVRSVMQINYGLINIPVAGSHNEINVHYHSTVSDAQLLREILRPLQSVAMQPENTPLASLGIEGLQKKYLEKLKKDDEIKDALAMYVALECTSMANTEKRFSLEEKVKDFLASEEKKVLLLLGEAGSGKSTFNRYLARSLWASYDNKTDKSGDTPIPLFIPLSGLEEPNANLIYEYLKKENFSDMQIAELKQNYRFIFILDGYDEIKDRTRMFYIENGLDQWQAKVIITSRPEYLGDRYERQFHPKNQAHLLQGYQLASLSNSTIEEYVAKYKEAYPEFAKSIVEHGEILEQSEVKELIRNPFLLKMTLSELPELSKKYKESGQHVTRLALYDQFIASWFNRSQDRLSSIRLTDIEKNAFSLLNTNFGQSGADFSKDFAIAMYQAGLVRVKYLAQPSWKKQSTKDWREDFLNNYDTETKLLRFNAPLICRDGQYQFIHKSIQDYFVARALWEELGTRNKIKPSFVFNTLNIVKDSAVLQFLAERVQQEPELKSQLLSTVEQSKGEDGAQFERGAANAITVLVKAGVQLINKDFNGIRVRGADLSYGVFDYTSFKKADLRDVDWSHAWLRKVDLSGADLDGVQLGERPALEVNEQVLDFCYTRDGRWFALASGRVIQLYEAETSQWVYTYVGHQDKVTSLAFSDDGQWLASGSRDKTVKLWLVSGGRSLVYTYSGHQDKVTSLAFSVDGRWLVTGSDDKTLKLWHLSGDRSLAYTYAEYEGEAVFSRNGLWLALGGSDYTVKLWSVSGDWSLAHTYSGHKEDVMSVAFSDDGKWLASGSFGGAVKLWSVTGDRSLMHTYYGPRVVSVAFSNDGQWLAFGHLNSTVTLWYTSGDRSLAHTYVGHREMVRSVTFSPDSQWLVSGGDDGSVKFWRVSNDRFLAYKGARYEFNICHFAFSADGHWLVSTGSDDVVTLWNTSNDRSPVHIYTDYEIGPTTLFALSSDGQWLASGEGADEEINLWHISENLSLAHTYVRHKSRVFCVAFSSDGQWLASGGGDKKIRLWHVSGDRSLAHTYVGHKSTVCDIAFSRDGQWLASGGMDKKVKLWNLSGDRSLAYTYVGHKSAVDTVVFSDDGKWLVSGSGDRTAKRWHISPRSLSHTTYAGHREGVSCVALSGDGQWLASGSTDGTVRIWSILTGDCQAILQNCIGAVSDIAWQPMQAGINILCTAGYDGILHFWRVYSNNLEQIDKIMLNWASGQKALTAEGAWIEGAQNLNPENKILLTQLGAGQTGTGKERASYLEEKRDKLFSSSDELNEVNSGEDFDQSFSESSEFGETLSEEDSDDLSFEPDELGEASFEKESFAKSDTNRYLEELSQNASNLANMPIQESSDLNAIEIARIRKVPFLSLEQENKPDIFDRLIENEFLLSPTRLEGTFWPEGELVEERMPDADFSSKKRAHSTGSISLEINRKKRRNDNYFL
ncbi:MAG: WD40 repeat [Glomeribacter sp. 1016415]|nr:WD40 repeat [Glomeribacter sp. 1016415]